ncbi:hypothetical protein O5699_01370 [Escherichia coli]|nr:hypothetical protein [Escherichia coli]
MMQQRIMQSAIKATHKGKELTKRQVKARDEVPTFEQLMAAIELEVRRYNNQYTAAFLAKRMASITARQRIAGN